MVWRWSFRRDHASSGVDFVFIDCVKTEYSSYLEALLPKCELGAVIVCDNLLWKGQVAEGAHDPNTEALREFNRLITTDARLMILHSPSLSRRKASGQ